MTALSRRTEPRASHLPPGDIATVTCRMLATLAAASPSQPTHANLPPRREPGQPQICREPHGGTFGTWGRWRSGAGCLSPGLALHIGWKVTADGEEGGKDQHGD